MRQLANIYELILTSKVQPVVQIVKVCTVLMNAYKINERGGV